MSQRQAGVLQSFLGSILKIGWGPISCSSLPCPVPRTNNSTVLLLCVSSRAFWDPLFSLVIPLASFPIFQFWILKGAEAADTHPETWSTYFPFPWISGRVLLPLALVNVSQDLNCQFPEIRGQTFMYACTLKAWNWLINKHSWSPESLWLAKV